MTHGEVEVVVVRNRGQEPAAERGEKQPHPRAHERIRTACLEISSQASGHEGASIGAEGVPQETVDPNRDEQTERTLDTASMGIKHTHK
jgi:hypothetical protein